MKKNTLRINCLSTFCTLLLAGCGYDLNSKPQSWLQQHNLPTHISPENLTLCVSFGCTEQRASAFSTAEWLEITNLFQPLAKSAAQERDQIASAIALMERQQGPKVGTQNDLPQNAFGFSVSGYQLDCVAESANTSIYLILLERSSLLKYHRVAGRAHRGPFTLNFPHNSAVVKERNSNDSFTIDSWYRANGEPPWITTLENWLNGASP